MPDRKRDQYHHGDLRRALVDAALERLERQGLAALSLRAIAADVGVSHAAPAHHFGNARGLETALAALGFDLLFRSIADAMAAVEVGDEAARLAAGMKGYLDHACAHPALFRLMFSAERLDWTDASLQASARAAREQLSDLVRPTAERLRLSEPEGRAALEHLVWATVHGRAHLMVDGQMGASGTASDRGEIDLAMLLAAAAPRPGTS